MPKSQPAVRHTANVMQSHVDQSGGSVEQFPSFPQHGESAPGRSRRMVRRISCFKIRQGRRTRNLACGVLQATECLLGHARRQDPWSETAQTLQFQSFRCLFGQGFHVATSTWSAWLISSRAATAHVNHSDEWNFEQKKKFPSFCSEVIKNAMISLSSTAYC